MKVSRPMLLANLGLAALIALQIAWYARGLSLESVAHDHAGPDFRPSDPAEIPPPAGKRLGELAPDQVGRLIDEIGDSIERRSPTGARYILILFDPTAKGRAHVRSDGTIDQVRAVVRSLAAEIEPGEDAEPGLDVPAAGEGGPK